MSEKVVILSRDELGNTCVYEILHVLIVFDDGDHCASRYWVFDDCWI